MLSHRKCCINKCVTTVNVWIEHIFSGAKIKVRYDAKQEFTQTHTYARTCTQKHTHTHRRSVYVFISMYTWKMLQNAKKAAFCIICLTFFKIKCYADAGFFS